VKGRGLVVAAFALTLAAPATAFAAQDGADKHPVKALEKIVKRCESDSPKKESDKLAEAQARCNADLADFFQHNDPVDLPESIKANLVELISSGYVALPPAAAGWDLKKNTGT
jgi:hypothetical protein